MKIALITNSRIPSLTANSIQAMKVAQALMQLGHDVRMFAPAEAEPVNYQSLLTHYGLQLAPPLDLLPSIRGLKRFDFIVHAQRAAEKIQRGLDLHLASAIRCAGTVVGLSRRARNARGRGGTHGRVVAASILEGKGTQADDGHDVSVEKGSGTFDQLAV